MGGACCRGKVEELEIGDHWSLIGQITFHEFNTLCMAVVCVCVSEGVCECNDLCACVHGRCIKSLAISHGINAYTYLNACTCTSHVHHIYIAHHTHIVHVHVHVQYINFSTCLSLSCRIFTRNRELLNVYTTQSPWNVKVNMDMCACVCVCVSVFVCVWVGVCDHTTTNTCAY